MKKSIFVFITVIAFATSIFAQKDETLFNRTGIKLTGAWGGSSLAISQINNQNVVYRGGFGGVEINKSIFLGWGGMELDNRFTLANDELLDMDYRGFIAGYAPSAHKTFHPQFMLMIGSGNLSLQDGGADKILVVQPSVGVEINVFRWFRVGLNGGYRMVTDTDIVGLNDRDLTTPYGEVKFKFGWSWGR